MAKQFGIYTMKGHSPRGHDHRAMWREMFDTATSDIATYSASYAGPADPDTHQIKAPLDGMDVSTHTALSKGRRQYEDTLGTCCFCTRVPLKNVVEAFNAVTGWDFTPQEAAAVGFRLSNVFRAFNLRNGIGPELEKFSPRWGSAPVDGPCVGVSVAPQWDSMLDNYYKLMGWDRKSGKPTQETLKKYGLEYLTKDLYPKA
jgi:aldehyde:ferredoxin oxidoreductase